MKTTELLTTEQGDSQECFVIMPIADVDDYPIGHFRQVYDNIIVPACIKANFKPVRADEVKQTNLIHLDILKKIIESPIAICDLSNRNPNVLFELGIRQAFDKPVVLIQERDTPKIFDIAPLRYLEYSKEMKYHDVLRSQDELKESLIATMGAHGKSGNVNSIVKLLALNAPANIPDIESGKEKLQFDFISAELREMRNLFEISMMDVRKNRKGGSIASIEYERITNTLDRITASNKMSFEEKHNSIKRLMIEAEEIMMNCRDDSEHMHFRNLMRRIQNTYEMNF